MRGGLLRDLRKNTELLILIELLEEPRARHKDIADTLGITVQAVGQYVAAMRKKGLLRERAGSMNPTRKGMQILQEHFVQLKDEVDSVLRKMSVIDRCVAFAGKDVRKGDKVGLLMEGGRLMAYPGLEASSTGKALEDAAPLQDVLVGHLEGIVDMSLGRLLVLEVPPELDGGSKRANLKRAKDAIASFEGALFVAGDVAGSALLSRIARQDHVVHAPVESAMSALSKGVSVVFCGNKDAIDSIVDSVTRLKKETGYEVEWKIVRA